jgi:hypothetical protein
MPGVSAPAASASRPGRRLARTRELRPSKVPPTVELHRFSEHLARPTPLDHEVTATDRRRKDCNNGLDWQWAVDMRKQIGSAL